MNREGSDYRAGEIKGMEQSLAQATDKPAQAELAEEKTISRWQIAFIIAIFIAITVCEYIFAYQNVAHGIVIALAMAIAIYTILSVSHFEHTIVRSAESLAIIPLYILFTSSMPWFFIDQQYLLPAVYSCILALCLWYIYQQNLSLKALFGIRKDKILRNVLMGISIGAVLGVGEYFILRPAPTSPTFEVKYLLRDIAYMLLFVGIAEEVLFRGIIQSNLTASFGWKWGLFAASALFAVMHLTWRSMPELGFVFIAGAILGFIYYKTNDLTAPIVAHAMNNVMLVAILPYIFFR